MRPRCLPYHSSSRIKGGKAKPLASHAAVLQIKPAFPPPANRVDLLQVKIRVFILNGDAHATHGILRISPLHTKETPPEPPMRINTQERLTQGDKAGNVQNPVRGQIMQLDTVGVQQAPHKRMQRKS